MNPEGTGHHTVEVALAVTTSFKPSPALLEQAVHLAAELNAPRIDRRKLTIARLLQEKDVKRLLVVGEQRWSLHDRVTGTEYFYHPNMIQVRAWNLDRGLRDLFTESTQVGPGDRLLDCTVGFASEAVLAARIVGPDGSVVGLESVPALAAITRHGVANFKIQSASLREAMRRVDIVTADYRDYLPRCAPGSYDVVYFDPFFPERLPGAENSVGPLAFFGNTAPLCIRSVIEARRVARRRVVVKHPFWAELPPDLQSEVSDTVRTRKHQVVYSVFTAF